MAVVAAAVVPHAPLISLGRAPETEAAARAVLRSLPPDVPWLLVSPHGSRTAVRERAGGSLASFGIPDAQAWMDSDRDVAGALAEGWTDVCPPDPGDQGAAVPLALLAEERNVVALSFAETTGPQGRASEDVLMEAKAAAEAMQTIARERDVALIASAHTAAALTPRAPIPERREGHELHEAVLDALASGAGMEDIAPDLWRAAGSCGAGPLSLVARVCAGGRFEVRCEEAPFGVGYVSALLMR